MEPDLVLSLVQQVDLSRLREHVDTLSTGERHSYYSAAHHSSAAEYISSSLADQGLAVRRHAFSLGDRDGVNIVGSMPGVSPRGLRPFLVSAHYDTVHHSPGADDNASGVAALLECARVLSTVRLQRGVEFVAFDMEEIQPRGRSLVGSSAFVRELGGTDSYEGLYNLEMVGYTSGPKTQGHPFGFQLIMPRVYNRVRRRNFLGDFVAVVGRGPGIELGRRFEDAAARWVPDLETVAVEMRHRIPLMWDIFRSDHAPFWLAGIPAVMITDTANFRNPHYHKPMDTPDTLDYDFMGNVTRALVATLAHQAEVL